MISLTNSMPAKKQEALLPGWIEGVFQAWDVWVKELDFHWAFLWWFFQLSLIILCTVCFFLEMRCVQFLNLTTTFGDLPTSLGFEWGLCPVLLSFKFTFNMFLFSAPLAHWGLLFGSLKFAASRGSSAGRWSYCKFFLDLWQREWSVKATTPLGSARLGVFSVPAVHSPPLLSEYFASALISLEIKMLVCY